MFTATIGLALADRGSLRNNPLAGGTDWRPDKYIEMYQDIFADLTYENNAYGQAVCLIFAMAHNIPTKC